MKQFGHYCVEIYSHCIFILQLEHLERNDRAMERTEQMIDTKASKAEEDASNRMLADVKCGCQQPMNIEQESSKIATQFDLNKQHDIYQSLLNGGKLLSEDLQKLGGNMNQYNELLLAVKDKIPGEPAANPYINLQDWN